jgi:alkylation response protein AidB-like acyl-CoA dehydrogenase
VQLHLTEDQRLLHDTSLRFVETELPLPRTRAWHDRPESFDRAWLQKAAELGWFAMLVPEELGGGSVSEHGLADLAILAEVQGRHAQPGPLIPMNLVAAAIAGQAVPELRAEVLGGVVAGATVATYAFVDDRGNDDGGAGVAVRAVGDELVVDGTRGFVQDLVGADEALVTASLDGRPVHVLVPTGAPGVVIEGLVGLDLGRRFAHVHLHDVRVGPHRLVDGGPALADRLLQLASVLVAADSVGAMDHLFEMTVTYAKDRIAFGRPIGSFQAIKHGLAEQALDLECSKAIAMAACDAVATAADGAADLASMAAAYVADQGNELAQECLQVHGGIGFTWEHPAHLFLRRARTGMQLFGSPRTHRERYLVARGA